MGKTRPAFPPEFRRHIVELLRAGRTLEQLAREALRLARGPIRAR